MARDIPNFDPTLISPDEEELQRWVEEEDIDALMSWFSQVIEKVRAFSHVMYEFGNYIYKFCPQWEIDMSSGPYQIIEGIKRILKMLEEKNDMLNLESISSDHLGSTLLVQLNMQKQRVSNVIDVLSDMMLDQKNEIINATTRILMLEANLNQKENEIQELKEGRSEDVTKEMDDFDELVNELRVCEQIQNELREEVENEKSKNHDLQKDMLFMQEKLARSGQTMAEEMIGLYREVDLNEGIRKSLLKAQEASGELSKEECEKAVDEWMEAISETFEQKKNEIRKVKEQAKSLDKQIVDQKLKVQNLLEESASLDNELLQLESQKQEIKEEANQLVEEMSELEDYVEELTDQQQMGYDHMMEQRGQSDTSNEERGQSDRSHTESHSPPFTDTSGFSNEDDSMPFQYDQSPHSHTDSPSSSRTSPDSSPSNAFKLKSPSTIELRVNLPAETPSPDLGESRFRMVPGTQTISPSQRRTCPGTQTIPHYQSRTCPGTQTMPTSKNRVCPGTQTMSTSQNRVCPGTQTMPTSENRVCPGTSTINQHKQTRFTSSLAREDTMPYSPGEWSQNVNSTSSPITSRQSYDSDATVMNVTPKDDNEHNNSFRKILLLSSPKREKPLLCNIDVTPVPLTETEAGEQFICDISVNLQETKQSMYQTPKSRYSQVSDSQVEGRNFELDSNEAYYDLYDPVIRGPPWREQVPVKITHGKPPEVTPTSTRKYGQFTPPSIFKKGHWNVQRLFHGMNEFPEDYKISPPTSYYYDKDMSWSPSYRNGLSPTNVRPDNLPSSPHNVTFSQEDRKTSPHSDKPFARSRTPTNKTTSADSNKKNWHKSSFFTKSLDRSPSPRRQTFDSSQSSTIRRPDHKVSSPKYSRSPDDRFSEKKRKKSPNSGKWYDKPPSPTNGKGHKRSPISPVLKAPRGFWRATFGSPPQVTPTTTRRHGPFTPKGIFKERHWNVRKLFDVGKDEQVSPPPNFYRNRTISWEESSPYYVEHDDSRDSGPDELFDDEEIIDDEDFYDKDWVYKGHPTPEKGTGEQSESKKDSDRKTSPQSKRLENTSNQGPNNSVNSSFSGRNRQGSSQSSYSQESSTNGSFEKDSSSENSFSKSKRKDQESGYQANQTFEKSPSSPRKGTPKQSSLPRHDSSSKSRSSSKSYDSTDNSSSGSPGS